MKLLLCAATRLEIAPLLQELEANYEAVASDQFKKEDFAVDVLITGVGLPLAAFSLGKMFALKQYDLALQVGVAGAIDPSLKLGQVVQVKTECFADLGVEEASGAFTSMHELGLIAPNQAPFQSGQLLSNASPLSFVSQVHAISVNKVHGFPASITQVKLKYPDAQIESMEGAAFFYACLLSNQKGMQIRSISNYVEARNRANWELEKAVTNLNEWILQMFEELA